MRKQLSAYDEQTIVLTVDDDIVLALSLIDGKVHDMERSLSRLVLLAWPVKGVTEFCLLGKSVAILMFFR